MTIVIQVYLIICICLFLFDVFFLWIKNRRNQEFFPKNSKLEEQINEEIDQHHKSGSFSESFQGQISSKLKKTNNLITLMEVLEQRTEAYPWFKPVVLSLIQEYQKKSDYEQAYYAYAISKFDYENDPVPGNFVTQFVEFLDSNSLYTFSNAMDAIYKFGNTNLLMNGIVKADKRQGSYHEKLIIDGLLGSKADFEELNSRLVNNFFEYSPFMQKTLLNYLRMTGFDIKELCLKLIHEGDSIDREVRYAAMRYFVKYPCDESKEIFLNIIKERDEEESPIWIEQMLAIQGLEKDNSPTIYEAISKLATSSDWYVRTKAVAYLHYHGLSKDDVFEILCRRDNYTNDALLYQYRNDKEMTKYIVEIIALLKEQDDQNQKNENLNKDQYQGNGQYQPQAQLV